MYPMEWGGHHYYNANSNEAVYTLKQETVSPASRNIEKGRTMKNSERRKTAGFLRRSFLGVSVMALLGVGTVGWAAEGIERLDFKDKAGNLLMSLDYDSEEAQTLFDGLDGKTNYKNNGYVLRRSKPEFDNSGRLKKSSFIDWDDRTVNWGTYSYTGEGADFTFYDHYEKDKEGSGKKVYGGSYSQSGNTYTFKDEQGNVTHSLVYKYADDGQLQAIEVLDKNGSMTHEVAVVPEGVGVAHAGRNVGIRSRRLTLLGDGTAVLNLHLTSVGNLKVEQYDLTGRLIAVLDQRTVKPGNHTLRFKTSPIKSATSVRLLKVSINGDSQVHRFTTVK